MFETGGSYEKEEERDLVAKRRELQEGQEVVRSLGMSPKLEEA